MPLPSAPVLNEQHRLVRIWLDAEPAGPRVVHDQRTPQTVRVLGRVVRMVPEGSWKRVETAWGGG